MLVDASMEIGLDRPHRLDHRNMTSKDISSSLLEVLAFNHSPEWYAQQAAAV